MFHANLFYLIITSFKLTIKSFHWLVIMISWRRWISHRQSDFIFPWKIATISSIWSIIWSQESILETSKCIRPSFIWTICQCTINPRWYFIELYQQEFLFSNVINKMDSTLTFYCFHLLRWLNLETWPRNTIYTNLAKSEKNVFLHFHFFTWKSYFLSYIDEQQLGLIDKKSIKLERDHR